MSHYKLACIPMRIVYCFISLILIAFTALPQAQARAVESKSAKSQLYFDTEAGQEERIDSFLKETEELDESAKINFLLSGIQNSELTYERNGFQSPGTKAALWLRWKMHHKQFKKNPISTADDFVDRVADRSRKTGIPYYAVMPNGKRIVMKKILRNELLALESAIEEHKVTYIEPQNYLEVPQESPPQTSPTNLQTSLT